MAINFKDVVKLAKGGNAWKELRSVVFDGKSAMTVAQVDWVVGVPCPQPHVSAPVVVPVDAIVAHLLKSRHLVVMPDHLSNGQGLMTPFNKPKNWGDEVVLEMLPKQPEGEAVSFDLELDALDRTLIAAGVHDIRYYLNGVLLDLTDGVLAGCDGHRLHVYRNRVPKAFKRRGKDVTPVELVLGRAPLDWIVGSASQATKVTIWNARRPKVDGHAVQPQILLQTEDAFVWLRKPVEGKYPDWRRVLPAASARPVGMEIDPVMLADTVAAMGKVVKLATEGKSQGVKVDFGRGQVMGIRADDVMPLEVKLSSQQADIDPAGLVDTLWVGVNAPYLQDLADCVTGAARWSLDHLSPQQFPILVTEGDFSGVVMPLRYDPPEEVAQEAAQAVEAAPAEPVAPEADREAQEGPETSPAEPCPAAVADIAAQLVAQVVEKAQESAKKAPRKGRKAAQVEEVAQAEPVAA